MTPSDTPATPKRPRRALDSGPWLAPIADEPVHATVTVPGSKSETNRALVLAALSDGPSSITGALDARDTQLMRDGLRALGVEIDDSGEVWRVNPPQQFTGGVAIDCGLAGTVMRFLPPLAALADGEVSFDGDEAARARPMLPLLDALFDMGADLGSEAAALPFTIGGRPDLPGGAVNIDSATSSQYVSGLLLAGARYGRGLDLRHIGDKPVPSRPHIDMTISMLRARGVEIDTSKPNRWIVSPGQISAKDELIQPDLSNAAPFLAAAAITGGEVSLRHWPRTTTQPGDALRQILTEFGAEVSLTDAALTVTGTNHIHAVDLDLSAASELTPVVAAIATLADGTSHLRGIGHIRGHETDRLTALETEFEKLGCKVDVHDDSLVIHPRVMHGADFAAYADHRMAHAAAVIGLIVDEIVVDDIGCTAKTMPEFALLWQQMLSDSDDWSEQHQ